MPAVPARCRVTVMQNSPFLPTNTIASTDSAYLWTDGQANSASVAMVYLRMVTHPSINWDWLRAASLIKINALSLSQTVEGLGDEVRAVSVRTAAAEKQLQKTESTADFTQRSILTVLCRQL